MQRPAFIALLFACLGLLPPDARGEEAPATINVSTLASPEWDCAAADRAFVHWRSTIGTNCGFSAIGNGRILIGTNNARPRDARITADCGVMMCFDLSDGRFLWQATHPRLPSFHADLPMTAIACTPAIAGDRAFYTSNRGELVCVDLLGFSDGENDGPFVGEQRDEHAADIVWVLDLIKDLGVHKLDSTDVGNPLPSPLVVGGSVFTITGNGTDYERVPAPVAPSFVAADRGSGRVKWSSAAPGGDIIRGQWASPALVRVAGRACVVFPGGDSRLYGFDPTTGDVIWKLDCVDRSDGSGPHSFAKQPIFWAAPAVVNDMLYIGLSSTFERRGGPHGKLLAIRLSESAGSLRAKVAWEFRSPRFGGTQATPAVREGVVYAQGVMGPVFAIDGATGHELWTSDLNADGEAAMYAAPVVHDGMLLVADPEYLNAFSLAPHPQCVGHYYFNSRLMSSPLVHEGRLYFAVSENLYCLRLPAEILKAPAGGR
ncbi:MAG TPA: PQQ-binding-like beta-propeller repeat protein [Pirellulales bacterium]|jgi:outer membrane protein assembly factor BamB|nr:PQQ-binding-like beta-propeller repeat protein [Pirellulales bacterium]